MVNSGYIIMRKVISVICAEVQIAFLLLFSGNFTYLFIIEVVFWLVRLLVSLRARLSDSEYILNYIILFKSCIYVIYDIFLLNSATTDTVKNNKILLVIAIATYLFRIISSIILTLKAYEIRRGIFNYAKKAEKALAQRQNDAIKKIVLLNNLSNKELRINQKYALENETIAMGKYVYILSSEDLEKYYEKDIKDKIFIHLYLIDKNLNYSDACKKVYEQYKNDILHGVLHEYLIIKILEGQESIEINEEYLSLSFIHYAEIENIDELSYQVILSSCHINKNNMYGIGISLIDDNEDTRQFFITQLHTQMGIDLFRGFGNIDVANFWNNATGFLNTRRSILATMDYCDMVTRLAAIYYYGKNIYAKEKISDNALITGRFNVLGSFISASNKVSGSNKRLDEILKFPNVISKSLLHMGDSIQVSFHGDSFSFLGIVSLIQLIRNKIVAHGALSDNLLDEIWLLIFTCSIILNYYLRIDELRLENRSNEFYVGYGDDMVSAGKFIMNNNGDPCIAIKVKGNKKIVYVDYYNGESIVPEYIESA